MGGIEAMGARGADEDKLRREHEELTRPLQEAMELMRRVEL
jgi:hypothetical protein